MGNVANGGMNWIRKDKRLAIHDRDGWTCWYCGVRSNDGHGLTLDHIVPDSQGGDNSERNLITACGPCNYRRQDQDVREFSGDPLALYRLAQQTSIKLAPFRKLAKRLLEAHGDYKEARATMAEMNKR